MDWMRAEEPKVEMCLPADPNMCGNMEARGVLTSRLPSFSNSHLRIEECKRITKSYCAAMFGQRYEVYGLWGYELCGEAKSVWVEGANVIATEYSTVEQYVNDEGAIVTPSYYSFLVLMVLIWWMNMLDEIRQIMNWWVIVMFYPTDHEEPFVRNGDKVKLNAIPLKMKMFQAAFHLLPRSFVAFCLGMIGTSFLINADSYANLILNSVVLAFLIELDNMIFRACVGDESKHVVEMCEPLVLKHSCPTCIYRTTSLTPPVLSYTFCVVVLAWWFVSYAYVGGEGKYDVGKSLACLCHASGDECISAQVLGGFESLSAIGERLTGSVRETMGRDV